MAKSRKRYIYWGLTAVALLGGAYGLSSLNGAKADFDPSRLGHRRTRHDGQVRRRHRQDRADLARSRSSRRPTGSSRSSTWTWAPRCSPGQVLAELDKELLAARLREEQANLLAAEANLKAARAQLDKNVIEAEGPDVEFARRAHERAQAPVRAEADRAVGPRRRPAARSRWPRIRQRSAKGQFVVSRARVAEAEAKVAQARAAVARAEEDLRNATIRAPIRATVLTRDVEIGSPVSSILNLGANATLVMTLGDIDGGVRAGQGGRSRHRPRAARAEGAASRSRPSRTRSSRARSRRSRRSASRRTTSPPSRWRSRSPTRTTSSRPT